MKARMMFPVLALALVVSGHAAPSHAARPGIMKGCRACHKPAPDVVRGKLVVHSDKFRTIQVDVGPVVWVMSYDENTEIKGAASFAEVKKGKEMAVAFKGPEDKPLATAVSFKQAFKLPEEMLVSTGEMMMLVAKGPEEGGFLLVDSRPPGAYASGHIPGAVSIPYPALDKKREALLPGDRDKKIIFYCGGFA